MRLGIFDRMSSRTTSRRPKAGQSMVADLQSLIIETALAKRAARRQPQNGLNRASKHDCFAVMGNGPLKGTYYVKNPNDPETMQVNIMRSGVILIFLRNIRCAF